MSNASVAEVTSRPILTEERPAENRPESLPCITIIDRPVAPVRAPKGDSVAGTVSLMMLAGDEFGRRATRVTARIVLNAGRHRPCATTGVRIK